MNFFVAPDGLKLHYLDTGEGLPLLCLPGLTRNAFDFDELAEVMAGRCRLIRLTFRGRMPSEFDSDYRNYVVPIEARDVVALLDHLGLERTVIVGTSRGGLVAMLLAAFAKDRLAGVLLNDIAPDLAPEGLERIMSYVGIAPKSDSFEALAASLEAMLGSQFPGLGPADWMRLARRWFAEAEGRPVLAYDPRLRDAMLEGSPGAAGGMWPLFDALEGVPLALVRGANSDLVTAETAARMQERRPDLIYAEIPDRGHVPLLNEPGAVAALDELLERVTR